jgi:hypothetical protein
VGGPALELVRVAHRPADPLDQLTGEVRGLEIGGGDPLPVDDLAGVLRRVGHYEYLWHASSFHWVARAAKLAKSIKSINFM